MREEQKEFRRNQTFIIEQLSRISNQSVAGNGHYFYGLAGRILNMYKQNLDFILRVLQDIGQKEFIENEFPNLVFGILKKEYYKTHDPCLESLDRIGIE